LLKLGLVSYVNLQLLLAPNHVYFFSRLDSASSFLIFPIFAPKIPDLYLLL